MTDIDNKIKKHLETIPKKDNNAFIYARTDGEDLAVMLHATKDDLENILLYIAEDNEAMHRAIISVATSIIKKVFPKTTYN